METRRDTSTRQTANQASKHGCEFSIEAFSTTNAAQPNRSSPSLCLHPNQNPPSQTNNRTMTTTNTNTSQQLTIEPETKSKGSSWISHLYSTYFFDDSSFPLPLQQNISHSDYLLFLKEVNDILAVPYDQCQSISGAQKISMTLYRKSAWMLILFFLSLMGGSAIMCFVWFIPNYQMRMTILFIGIALFIISNITILARVLLSVPLRRALLKIEEEKMDNLKRLITQRNQYFEPKGVQFILQVRDASRFLSYHHENRRATRFFTKFPVLNVYINNAMAGAAPQYQPVPAPQPNQAYPNSQSYGASSQGTKQEPVYYQQAGNADGYY